jgi:DNA-binding MarR family transcriptional regulator
MTQRELSEVLRCTARNVTALVDGLQAGGYVTRGPHPSDRRATLVALTEQGTRTARNWTRDYRSLATSLFGELTPAELGGFVAGLDKVLVCLRQSVEPAPAEA